MKGIFKVLASLIGLVLGIVILLAIYLVVFLDPNDYKDDIQVAVKDSAKIELNINGAINWSLFPWLGLNLADVSVTPLDQPDSTVLAKFNQLGIKIKLAPLLSATPSLEIQGLIIDGLNINLVVNEQGQANWQALISEEPDTATNSTPSPDANTSTDSDINLNIAEVSIINANIVYDDKPAKQRFELADFSIKSKNINLSQAFPIEVNLALSASEPIPDANLTLSTNIQLNSSFDQYTFTELELDMALKGDVFNGKTVPINLTSSIDLDLAKNQVSINDLNLIVAQLRLMGQLNVIDFTNPAISGQIRLPDFDANQLLTDLGQSALETTDPVALKNINLSATLIGKPNSVEIKPLKINIDGSVIDGSIWIYDLANQALRFQLMGDRFDVDRYLPPSTDEAATQTPPTASANTQNNSSDDEPLIPSDLIKTLNIEGGIRLNEVIATGLKFNNIGLKVKSDKGVVNVTELNVNAYGGTLKGKASLNVNKRPEAINAQFDLNNVQSELVAKALVQVLNDPKLDLISGKVALASDLKLSGNSLNNWLSSLAGTAQFTMQDGMLKRINLTKEVCKGIARLNKETINDTAWPDTTQFKTLGGSFNIKNGIADNQDLSIDIGSLKTQGKGNINIKELKLDYQLGVVVVGDTSDTACRVNEKLMGISFPVRCKGAITDAAELCKPDTAGFSQVLATVAKRELQNKVDRKIDDKIDDKLGDKLPDEVKDKVKGVLKGIFGPKN